MKILNQAASTRCGAGNKEKLSASTRNWLASGFCHDRKSALKKKGLNINAFEFSVPIKPEFKFHKIHINYVAMVTIGRGQGKYIMIGHMRRILNNDSKFYDIGLKY